MSCTEMVVFDAGGVIVDEIEFRNAYGSAMMVWESLWGQYVFDRVVRTAPLSLAGRDLRRGRIPYRWPRGPDWYRMIWDLAYSPEIRDCERVVLRTTGDRAVLRREHFARVAEALVLFQRAYACPGYACSLAEQAAVLRELLHRSPEDVAYVAWNQTSVNPNRWTDYELDDDDDSSRPYNPTTDADHVWVIDETENR